MFATLRRHQKWFWAAIIAVVIPSFVIFFTSDAVWSVWSERAAQWGVVYGKPIPRERFYRAYQEAELFYFLRAGSWPGRDESSRQSGFDTGREAYRRVLIGELLERDGVSVGKEAAARWVANFFRDPRQNTFRMENYEQVVQAIRKEKGMREQDIDRLARHQVGIQSLGSVYGMSGALVPPSEAEALYRIENEQAEARAVVFAATNYLAAVTLTTNAIEQFYTNQLSRYRIPERVQMRYVKFDLTNFWSDADQRMAKETNLAQRIDEVYARQGAESFRDTNGVVMAEAAAKNQLRERVRKGMALEAAMKKAGAFASELFAIAPMKADNLNSLAATNNLAVEITQPFSQYDGPSDLDLPGDFGRRAFALTDEEPFLSPVAAEDGVYLVALHRKIPAEFPAKEAIWGRLMEDYRQFQALEAARQAGRSFYQTLTNGLAQGQAFTNLCAEAKAAVVNLPPFAQASRYVDGLDDRLDLDQLKQLTARLRPGQASGFTLVPEGGFVLYLEKRTPVDEAKMKQELESYLQNLRLTRQYQSFEDWFEWQVARSGVMLALEQEEKQRQKEPSTQP
ncbi:MAG TPA: SurA N-terminal domain-containing protein [Candidatus Paceibacterota bacterium]|nr:SurA N-terminal domain-containing protein [Verrucomicrobiota bacterium]HRZ46260.1 SurA N-terminal domain-containing protein [Candidatus Paceibacterota bacterium]HRZ94763.1 SurA N-terminal domain-containing protein [Candidatus Paceibacterota bacterium]